MKVGRAPWTGADARYSDTQKRDACIASKREAVAALSAMSIRNLDARVKERLRVRAARHGRSMKAEARAILTDALSEPGETDGLLQAMLARFGELGGVELDLPPGRPRLLRRTSINDQAPLINDRASSGPTTRS
jgi:antitoxin FitA